MNLKKRLVKSHKIYLRDSGILHHQLNIRSFNELHGHIFLGVSREGCVIEQIRQVLPIGNGLYFYRYAGMLKESVQEMEKIVALDPNNSAFRSIIFTYLALGDYQKVVETLNRYKESDFTIYQLGFVFLRQGNYKLAVENFNRVIETEPEGSLRFNATLFKAYIEGNITEALVEAQKLEDLNISDSEFWYFLASYYSLLGERDGCVRALRRAVDGGYFNYPYIITDSFLDSMRHDPEFQKVLEEVKGKHLAFKKGFFEHI